MPQDQRLIDVGLNSWGPSMRRILLQLVVVVVVEAPAGPVHVDAVQRDWTERMTETHEEMASRAHIFQKKAKQKAFTQ